MSKESSVVVTIIISALLIAALIHAHAPKDTYRAPKDPTATKKINWATQPSSTTVFKDRTCYHFKSPVYKQIDMTPVPFNICIWKENQK